MTTDANTLSVSIFGNEYKIRGADPKYIRDVAAYVDQKMRELEGRLTSGAPARIAILTSLNIADELFREREERTRMLDELRGRALELGAALDRDLRED